MSTQFADEFADDLLIKILREQEQTRQGQFDRHDPNAASVEVDGHVIGTCLKARWLEVTDKPRTNPTRNTVLVKRFCEDALAQAIVAAVQPANRSGMGKQKIPGCKYPLKGVIRLYDRKPADFRFTFGTNGIRAEQQGYVTPTYILRAGLLAWLASADCRLTIINGNTGWVGRHMVSVDGVSVLLDGNSKPRFILADVFRRFALLEKFVESKTEPPRDFHPVYRSPLESAKAWTWARQQGEGLDMTMPEWQQQNEGDWQCRGCPWLDYCVES